MDSLMTCSGQGGVVTKEKEKEKECVVKDIGYNPYRHSWSSTPLSHHRR